MSKIDINSLSEEQKAQLSKNIGEFVNEEMGAAVTKVQELLGTYGLEFHVMWDMIPEGYGPKWQNPAWFKEQLEDFVSAAESKSVKKKPTKKKTPKKTTTKKSVKKSVTKESKTPSGGKMKKEIILGQK